MDREIITNRIGGDDGTGRHTQPIGIVIVSVAFEQGQEHHQHSIAALVRIHQLPIRTLPWVCKCYRMTLRMLFKEHLFVITQMHFICRVKIIVRVAHLLFFTPIFTPITKTLFINRWQDKSITHKFIIPFCNLINDTPPTHPLTYLPPPPIYKRVLINKHFDKMATTSDNHSHHHHCPRVSLAT